MKLFNKKQQDVVAKHSNASAVAFEVFNSTIASLNHQESEIDSDIKVIEDVLAKAEADKKALIAIKNKNSNFAKKLQEFMS